MEQTPSSFFDEDMLAKEPGDGQQSTDKAQHHVFSQVPQRDGRSKIRSSLIGKEVLDRIGFGFGAQQFIIILFFLTGAGPLLVGILNGLKDLFSNVISSFLSEVSKVKTFSKQYVAIAGIIFGFSMIGILFALRMEQVWLYAIALFVGNMAIVVYGELHHHITTARLPEARKSTSLRWLASNGLFITAISFLISGFLLETFWAKSQSIILLGIELPISGEFIALEIAAISFILSGFMLQRLPIHEQKERTNIFAILKRHWHELLHNVAFSFKQKYLTFMLLGSVLITAIESLGAAFYGYYIYEFFKFDAFGGFLNVAIVFVIALFVSLLGPRLTRFLQRHMGVGPLFIFGTLLAAMLPIALLYNPLFFIVL